MARSRNLKPQFFTDDELAALPALTRLLFAGLWTVADRAGRVEDRPQRIKAEVLPYDNCRVEKMLAELATGGFILRYVVDGKRYIQIRSFSKHQNPHVKEPASSIPAPPIAPDKHHASTVQAPDENDTKTVCGQNFPEQAGRIPSNGFPLTDSGFRIPDSRQPPETAKPGGDKSPEKPKPNGNGQPALPSGWWRTDDGIAATAKAAGVQPRPGESFRDLKDRVFAAIHGAERGAA